TAKCAKGCADGEEQHQQAGEEGSVICESEETGVHLTQNQSIGDGNNGAAEDGGENATQDALENEGPAHKPVGGADQFHDLDLVATDVHRGSDRVHDD